MAKVLVISDDGLASAEVVNAADEGEEPWYEYRCDCTRRYVYGSVAGAVLAAISHLDHHKVHRPVRSPGVSE